MRAVGSPRNDLRREKRNRAPTARSQVVSARRAGPSGRGGRQEIPEEGPGSERPAEGPLPGCRRSPVLCGRSSARRRGRSGESRGWSAAPTRGPRVPQRAGRVAPSRAPTTVKGKGAGGRGGASLGRGQPRPALVDRCRQGHLGEHLGRCRMQVRATRLPPGDRERLGMGTSSASSTASIWKPPTAKTSPTTSSAGGSTRGPSRGAELSGSRGRGPLAAGRHDWPRPMRGPSAVGVGLP